VGKPFTPEERRHRLDSLIATYNIQIDPEDYRAALKYTWSLHRTNLGYVSLRTNIPRTNKMLKLHRFILYRKRGYRWWKRGETMHLDGNVFNLRRSNLALGSHNTNLKLNKSNKSGYPNVSWHKHARKWRVQIGHNNKRISLGMTNDLEQAALCAYEAALYYHGVEPPATYYELLDKQLEMRLSQWTTPS
jgi:hypothetical protein